MCLSEDFHTTERRGKDEQSCIMRSFIIWTLTQYSYRDELILHETTGTRKKHEAHKAFLDHRSLTVLLKGDRPFERTSRRRIITLKCWDTYLLCVSQGRVCGRLWWLWQWGFGFHKRLEKFHPIYSFWFWPSVLCYVINGSKNLLLPS